MQHPGPYIPATRDRIGARVEWLARLALWEAHEAAGDYFGRTWARPSPAAFYRGVMSDPRQRDYERLRNAEAREQVEAMLNNPNPYSGEGMQNALNNPNPTRINPAAFPWGEYYEGDTTVVALNDLARACGYR